MKPAGTIHRVAAFAESAGGGNPAGVWVGDTLPQAADMQSIAAAIGYSETIFVAPASGNHRTVRYFSPEAEVPFCGHATIAAGFVLGSARDTTTYTFSSAAGDVPVAVRSRGERTEVSLTSVDTQQRVIAAETLDKVLDALGWSTDDLDPALPPVIAYAGAWHLVLAVSTAARLAELDYDFDRLRALMLGQDLTTLQLVRREAEQLYHARNPFPVGGVVEDPATGAAAAALGGYLRDSGLVGLPFSFKIVQGEAMGRPSVLYVDVPRAGGITVTGVAVEIHNR